MIFRIGSMIIWSTRLDLLTYFCGAPWVLAQIYLIIPHCSRTEKHNLFLFLCSSTCCIYVGNWQGHWFFYLDPLWIKTITLSAALFLSCLFTVDYGLILLLLSNCKLSIGTDYGVSDKSMNFDLRERNCLDLVFHLRRADKCMPVILN